MSSMISTDYRELHDQTEILRVAEECAHAWQHEDIPRLQYELCVREELHKLANGISNRTFDALIECMRKLPMRVLAANPFILDVGAAAGYYSEVLKRLLGFRFRYRAVDFSFAFESFARELYLGIDFDVEDACALPYHDDSYDIVLHSACIMHCYDYRQAIYQAARVADRYIIFHRTPVSTEQHTRFFMKKAYGIDCLEISFNEKELLQLFEINGLKLMHTADIFWNGMEGHRTYLLTKGEHERHIQV